MENLFLEQPEFGIEKTAAGKKVSDRPGQWVKEVMTYFHEEYPQLAQMPADINFTQQDEEKGTAIGSLIIRDWKVALPIVIKEYVLSPLDIAVFDGKILPFNEETLNSMFSQKSAFKGVVNDDSTERLRRIFGRDLEPIEKISEYSVLSGLNGKISAEGLEKVNKMVSGYEFSEAGKKVLEKIGQLEVFEDAGPDFYALVKTGQFEYEAKMGNIGFDNDINVEIDSRNIDSFRKNMASMGATEYLHGDYSVKIASMRPIYEDNLVNFDGSDLDIVLKSDNSGNYSMEKKAKIVSLKNKDGSFTLKLVPDTKIRRTPVKVKTLVDDKTPSSVKVANFGSFIIGKGLSKPVSLEKIAEYEKSIEIEAFDGLEMVKIAMIPGIEAAVVSEDEDFDYYLPMNTKFVKLGSFVDNFNKTANLDDFSVSKHKIRETDGKYHLDGVEFNKYAELGYSIDNLSEDEAKWALTKLGMPIEEINKVGTGSYIIQNELKCPVTKDTFMKNFTPFEDAVLDMSKEASVMSQQGTVDALLSLGFLNKENLNYFIEQIPTFESVLGTLARLLLSVRLGLSEIPENAVTEAMNKMSIVVSKLYELGTVLKKNRSGKH